MSQDALALRDAPGPWSQAVRFGVVGASGYAVNLVMFTSVLQLGAGHRLAATVAFLVALANNFAWNRLGTFEATGATAGPQALRFVAVSVMAFGVSLAVLESLTRAGMPEVVAQTLAIGIATPVNFIGNRVWAFRRPA